MTKKELNKIKIYLKKTDRKLLAEKYKVTEDYVRAIIRGSRHNDMILEACINMAFKIKNKKEKLSQKIAQL